MTNDEILQIFAAIVAYVSVFVSHIHTEVGVLLVTYVIPYYSWYYVGGMAFVSVGSYVICHPKVSTDIYKSFQVSYYSSGRDFSTYCATDLSYWMLGSHAETGGGTCHRSDIHRITMFAKIPAQCFSSFVGRLTLFLYGIRVNTLTLNTSDMNRTPLAYRMMTFIQVVSVLMNLIFMLHFVYPKEYATDEYSFAYTTCMLSFTIAAVFADMRMSKARKYNLKYYY